MPSRQGSRIVALFWFHEEEWSPSSPATLSYKGLLNYFHNVLQTQPPGQKTAKMREHVNRLGADIAVEGASCSIIVSQPLSEFRGVNVRVT